MDVVIWQEEQLRLLGICLKRGPAYTGPYPTTALQFQPNVLLLAANSWLYLIDVQSSKVQHSRNFKREVSRLAAGRKMIVVVMDGQIELLNEKLETVRSFELQSTHRIVGLWYTTKGFLVHYNGEMQLNSQPLVRFVRVSPQGNCCYHKSLRIRFQKGVLLLENMDNNFIENVQLSAIEGLPEEAKRLQCKEVGAVLTISIDRKVAVCVALDDHHFLYSISCGKLVRQVGPYLAETKGKLIYITFLDEGGPFVLGTLPVQDDEIEAILPIGSSFYIIKQILQDSKELRRTEKCEFGPIPSPRCVSEPLLQNISGVLSPPHSPRQPQMPILTISEPSERPPVWEPQTNIRSKEQPLPKFRKWESEQRPPTHAWNYNLHEDHIPCSPVVEIVENHKDLFSAAKQLFFASNIEQIPHEENSESQQNSFAEVENSGQTSKFAFATNYKLSFGSMETIQKQPEVVPPTPSPEQFLKGGEVTVAKLLEFIGTLPKDHQPSEVVCQKISLLDRITLADYQLICSSQPMVLLEELYPRHGKKLEAIELFIEEVIKFEPSMASELLDAFPQATRLEKMTELLGRFPNENLRKKFKRECYQFLSELPLKLVPVELLVEPLKQQQTDLLLFFHPDVKLVELSNPVQLLATILEIYFNDDEDGELESDCVEIEGEVIEITNPRNMLNIILYFAEMFECAADQAIRRYLAMLLSKNLVDLVDHIVYTEGVIQLCGLPNSLIEEIIKNYERDLYYKEGQSLEDFQQCLELVRQDLEFKRKANCRLNIIQSLARQNVLILYSEVYVLDQLKNGFQFLLKIIQQEAPDIVLSVGLESLYENVWILEDVDNENSKLSFYTRQLLELAEALIVRCFECRKYEEGLDCMTRIHPRLKLGLIAHCLLCYLNNQHPGSYSEELTNDYMPLLRRYNRDSLLKLLELLCRPQNSKNDFELATDEYSESQCGFVCSIGMMREKFNRSGSIVRDGSLLDSQKFCTLLFYRSKVATIMARYDKGINSVELKAYLTMMQKLGYFNRIEEKKHKPKEICPQLPISLAIRILERWVPEQSSPYPRSEMPDNKTHTGRSFADDYVKRTNSVEHLVIVSYRQECKSMATEDPRNRKKKNTLVLRRRESSPESLDVSGIKQLVNHTTDLREYLKEFYSKNTSDKLERLIQKAKVSFNLYWTEQLRNIEDYDVSYDYRRIFPFEFLCEKDPRVAFEIIRPLIQEELCQRTFWMIAYIVGYVLGEQYGRKVAVMYIEKLLQDWKEDCLQEEKEQIQAVIEFYGLHGDDIAKLSQFAEQRRLKDVCRLLNEHYRRDSTRRVLFSTS